MIIAAASIAAPFELPGILRALWQRWSGGGARGTAERSRAVLPAPPPWRLPKGGQTKWAAFQVRGTDGLWDTFSKSRGRSNVAKRPKTS